MGAVLRTIQAKLFETVSVGDFGARPGVTADQGPAILAAHTYAQASGLSLTFPGGEYTIGPSTSFIIDLSKTRWRGDGAVTLRWTSSPVSGCAVTIVNSEAAAYETSRRMVGRIIDNIAICGSDSYVTSFPATGLRLGNDVNITCGFTVSHVTLSGWSNCIDYRNNVWSVTLEKCRVLWGTITTPRDHGNWGENNVLLDCFIADGVIFTINYGEWRFFGGSLDNSQLLVDNYAYVAGFGMHLENPGSTVVTFPFINIRGSQATVFLSSPVLVLNNSGAADSITVSPFYVDAGNTACGLILDSMSYTQGGAFGFYSLVAGGGRVVARDPQILAYPNFAFTIIAENVRGQLRNYGFESGNLTGWTFSANTSFGTLG